MKKQFLVFLIALSMLLTCAGCGSTNETTKETTKDETSSTTEVSQYEPVIGGFTLSELQEDYKQFENVVKTQQSLAYADKDEVYAALDTQYKLLKDNMTELDFYRVLSPVISKINSGHTWLNFSEAFEKERTDKAVYLPLDLKVIDDKLYMMYIYGRSPDINIPYDSEILSIDGKSSKDIIETMKNDIAADGSNTTFKYYLINNNFNDLYYKYVEAPESFKITYEQTNFNLAKPTDITIPAVTKTYLNSEISKRNPQSSDTDSKYVTGKDYAVLTIKSFNYYDNKSRDKFKSDIDNFFNSIKDKKINNLILDLRGNTGGDPYCSSYIFTHLINKPLIYFAKDVPYYSDLEKPLNPVPNAFTGKLYVLINGGSFSSTGHLCSLLKYNSIGYLIGEETGGSFSCIDGSKDVSLKNTGIKFHYSTTEYKTAVSGMTPGRGIIPDMEIKYTLEDAALLRDLEMEYAVGQIEKSLPPPPKEEPGAVVSEMKVTDGDTFAYITNGGYLKLRSLKDGTEQTITDKDPVGAYDFNVKDGLAAYNLYTPDGILGCKSYLYDFNSKTEKVIAEDPNYYISNLQWSPSGKYVAVTFGGGPGTSRIKLYDAVKGTWLKVPGDNGITANRVVWAPAKDILGLEFRFVPNPPSEIGEGETFSAAVYFVESGQLKTLMEGNTGYGYDIPKWIDDNKVFIEKRVYSDFDNRTYYEGDINSGSVKEVQEDKLLQNLPDEVKNSYYSISPDGKYILYSYYDDEYVEQRVAIWDIAKQEKTVVCPGSSPKWITN